MCDNIHDYDLVNTALNDYFFRGRFEMLPVYLDLEGDAETSVSEALDIDPGELGDTIGLSVAGSLRFDKTNPYTDQLEWLKNWIFDGYKEPPPFTALLCALSIAAERMGVDQNFSPNNYYIRLFETLDVADEQSQRKLRSCAKNTQSFWRALKVWLLENDFLFGRPTARAVIPGWKYVSYALSQALVREVDRNRFIGLFETYDMNPGEPISAAEMELRIHQWMVMEGSNGPTNLLRRLWARNELRQRVVLSALDKFEVWDKLQNSGNEGPRNTRLQWQLGFVGFPRPRARLFLVATRSGQEEALAQDLMNNDNTTEFFLKGGFEPDVYFLGPVETINLGLLLLQSRQFTGTKSGIIYNYRAKPIIPLVQSQDGPVYNEVSRVSLFDKHVILCHKTWLARVERHFTRCARPGYEVFSAEDMEGIPEDWCILRGIEVVRSVVDTDENIQLLNPIEGTVSVACLEGLKLGPGTWHTDAPPVVQATSETSEYTVDIVREHFGEEDKIVSKEAENDFLEVSLDVENMNLGTNLRAIVRSNGRELAESSFSLRNADIPRPLGKRRIFHTISIQGIFLCSPDQIEMENQSYLEGCALHGDFDIFPAVVPDDAAPLLHTIPDGNPEMWFDLDWQLSGNFSQSFAESCVIRGYHYWIIESFEAGDNRYAAIMGKCRDCHAQALFRRRHGAAPALEPAPAPEQMPIEYISGARVSLDTVFNGLCYLGQGTWTMFQRLASAASPEVWFAHSLAADLFALGHLEMPDPFQVTAASDWSVPPPVLVIGPDSNGYLAGFHSGSLLERIDAALQCEGARYETISVPEQVTVHRWSGLAGLDFRTLLDGITDPHGRPIKTVCGIGGTIARHLPPLNRVWNAAAPVHIENVDSLAKFDVHRVRWVRVDQLEGQGAYRVGLHGTRYVYSDPHGTTRQVGHRVAKILAARDEGVRLHMYDPATSQFTSTLGAEPPGLFSRSIVASSGMLPTKEGGRLVYANVEPAVAAEILNKMYGKDEDHG